MNKQSVFFREGGGEGGEWSMSDSTRTQGETKRFSLRAWEILTSIQESETSKCFNMEAQDVEISFLRHSDVI